MCVRGGGQGGGARGGVPVDRQTEINNNWLRLISTRVPGYLRPKIIVYPGSQSSSILDTLVSTVAIFFFVGLWSQSADKLTIHSIPCSWIL